MKNKKLIVAVLAVLVLVGLLLGFWFGMRAKTTEGQKSFSVTVVHADGTTKDFAYKSNEEYVGVVLEAEGLITGEEGPYGMYIKEVDGERAVYEEDNADWGFYIGEEYALTGIDQTPIEDGQTYKLVYEPAA